jgi:thiol-disulfide isomerase/thioredoxin
MKNGILIAIMAVTLLTPNVMALEVGQNVPALSELLPRDSIPDTSGKVVLVDFWASWCGPCKLSFPTLKQLHEKYADKGLVIIGIGVDDKAEEYKKFISKMGVSFPIFHDATHTVADKFAPPSMPTSYIIDRKGVVRYIHIGFRGQKTEAEYVKEIESLLGK